MARLRVSWAVIEIVAFDNSTEPQPCLFSDHYDVFYLLELRFKMSDLFQKELLALINSVLPVDEIFSLIWFP